ncbi:LD-carboxypeptidase [bacterium]|nr:LD-carboxypeptidase [bacterium]
MNLIKPEKLNIGDTISIIAPAGAVDKIKIEHAVKYFETKGYKVKLGSNIYKNVRYMAGSEEERLSDIYEAFSDKEVKAIICARGGFGCIRLINQINFDIIKNNPKIFCGYSDITTLSLVFLKNAGLITFSGSMAQSDFADNIDAYSEQNFWNTLTNNYIEIESKNIKIYKEGDTEGILFGGNLATIASMCGIDFIPNEKFIFFAEDLNEPVYKLDRYLTQLLNIEEFRNNLAGIVFGEFINTDNESMLDNLFQELAEKTDIPIYSGYPISHGKTKTTVPIGAQSVLEKGIIKISY